MKERAQIFTIILIASTVLGFVVTGSLVNLKSPHIDIQEYFSNRFCIVWAVISVGLMLMFTIFDLIIEWAYGMKLEDKDESKKFMDCGKWE